MIAPCSCASPWHDPNQQAPIPITYDGNFNKSAPARRNDTGEGSKEPVQKKALAGQEAFYIFPNPVSSKVWIEAADTSGRQHVLVFNSAGQIIYQDFHDFRIEPKLPLNLVNHPKGLYSIRLFNSKDGTSFNQNIILK